MLCVVFFTVLLSQSNSSQIMLFPGKTEQTTSLTVTYSPGDGYDEKEYEVLGDLSSPDGIIVKWDISGYHIVVKATAETLPFTGTRTVVIDAVTTTKDGKKIVDLFQFVDGSKSK